MELDDNSQSKSLIKFKRFFFFFFVNNKLTLKRYNLLQGAMLILSEFFSRTNCPYDFDKQDE